MNKSDSIAKIAEALSQVQANLRPAKKDVMNPFFKKTYADLNSVWDSCRALLAANKLSVLQTTSVNDGVITLDTVLLHSSGEWVSGSYPINPIKNDPQAIGSAVTYARRYSLAAMIGIVADEDDDGNAASHAAPPPKKVDSKGNVVAKKPEWFPEQQTEVGKIHADIIDEFGDAGSKAWTKLRSEHAYDQPSDVIELAYTLLNTLREEKNPQ
jgi:hypothetical protein